MEEESACDEQTEPGCPRETERVLTKFGTTADVVETIAHFDENDAVQDVRLGIEAEGGRRMGGGKQRRRI